MLSGIGSWICVPVICRVHGERESDRESVAILVASSSSHQVHQTKARGVQAATRKS